MAKYEPNPDGKYQCPKCDYGHGAGNGKSRQSVSKHFNKLHTNTDDRTMQTANISEGEAESWIVEIQEDAEAPGSAAAEPESFDFKEAEDPSWISAGVLDTGDQPIKPSPMSAPVKGFLKSLNKEAGIKNKGKKKTAKEQTAWNQQQARLVRWSYVCIDRLVVWWGRGVLEDPSWDITRSEDEWRLMEAATTGFLDHHNLSIPVNPDMVFVATLAGAYVPPIKHVAKNKKKKILSWKNPIKAYFARRKLKKIARAREGAEIIGD
jgi:hypothetical protein